MYTSERFCRVSQGTLKEDLAGCFSKAGDWQTFRIGARTRCSVIHPIVYTPGEIARGGKSSFCAILKEKRTPRVGWGKRGRVGKRVGGTGMGRKPADAISPAVRHRVFCGQAPFGQQSGTVVSNSQMPCLQWYHLPSCTTTPVVPFNQRHHLPCSTRFPSETGDPVVQSAQWCRFLSGAVFSVVPFSQWNRLPSGTVCPVVQAAQWCHFPSDA